MRADAMADVPQPAGTAGVAIPERCRATRRRSRQRRTASRAAVLRRPPRQPTPAMSRRRVVVTGMGIVSPVGVGLAAAWDSIRNARSGVGPDHALRLLGVSDAHRGRGEGFRRRQVPFGEGSAALRHVRPLRPRGDDGRGRGRRARRLRRRQGARRRLHRLGHRRPAADRGDEGRVHGRRLAQDHPVLRARLDRQHGRRAWRRSTTATRARTSPSSPRAPRRTTASARRGG